MDDDEVMKKLMDNPKALERVKAEVLGYTKRTNGLERFKRIIERDMKNCLGFDLRKKNIRVTNEIRDYCNFRGWTILGDFLYFDDVKVKTKTKGELLDEYKEEKQKLLTALRGINKEIVRLESDLKIGK